MEIRERAHPVDGIADEARGLRRQLQQVSEEHRRSQHEWEQIFDTLPDAIAICDGDGRVVRGNQALWDVTGARPDPDGRCARSIDELLAPMALAARVREVLSTSGVVVCDDLPPVQGRAYAATISPIAEQGGPGASLTRICSGAVVLLRDVTDERRMQRRLVLGERMAAVGQLAAGLAHEINNPVSFAYSNLQMARELISQPGEMERPAHVELAEMLDECMVGIGRVRDIVRDLRTFTSTEVRSAAGEVRLDDIIDLGLRLTRSEVQRRARLVYDRDLVPMPLLRGDADKLSHVLLNLIGQALHNLPPGDDADASGHKITVRTRVDLARGLVELIVADTGPTLSEEMRAHLFEPFAQRRVRLPPSVSAKIGMGLAVSYEVVRRHGGEIEARPGADGGNEVIVRLPVVDQGREHAAMPSRSKVLFIDDEPMLLRSYRRLIGEEHDVTTVSSAQEALDLLAAGESFDTIFCDMVMPVMDGPKLYRAVQDRDALCAQRFVFLTSGAFTPEALSFLGEVQNPHVDKPVQRESLMQAIERLRAAMSG